MTDIPFYTKQDFVKLMRQKRGTEFTFGWLAMAYALPPVPEDAEHEIIRKEVPILQALPDYDGV
jgi:hypothetical protein